MAHWQRRVKQNVPGEFFVDETCIDCDACRQLAPRTFAEADDTSYVYQQPSTDDEFACAARALLACPTGSIGYQGEASPGVHRADFPLLIAGPVFYCGFNSRKSYGGNSYFVTRDTGNWLVDAPRFTPALVEKFRQLGGVRYIFLTHRDDIADAARYATEFGARCMIHREELAAFPSADIVIDGWHTQTFAAGVKFVPTPGHTAGHTCLLIDDEYLFTGDHLAWSRTRQELMAYRDYCWDSWPQQIESLARLQQERFSWVLPGHGQRVQLPIDAMQIALRDLVRRCREKND